jgi:spermidine synthase
MKPWETLDTTTVDGTTLTLARHDREFLIVADTVPLMSSRTHGSEDALATAGCRHARGLPAPCVLVGGLGMGFTLRVALDVLPSAATVIVAELVPAVVAWNRGVLGPLAGHPLDDPRVRVVERDVAEVLRAERGRFDAALLDIDNGPSALTSHRNTDLYTDRGIARARAALRPGGTLAVWSTGPDRQFVRRLRSAGFDVTLERARGHRGAGPKHLIFLAQYQAPRTERPRRTESRSSSDI